MSRGNQGHVSGSAALSETQFHRAVAGFLTLRLRPPDFFSTFPARWLSGSSGQLQGAALKRLGMKAGMPDIFPLIINGVCYGIELKIRKGKLSDVQKATHGELLMSGAVKDIALCVPAAGDTLDHLFWVLSAWDAKLSDVTPSAHRLQMAIAAWQTDDRNRFPVDKFPATDYIGKRRGRPGRP
jgi:hypothetical protein